MNNHIHLINGSFYHVYNCGINGENLFVENDNYRYFLSLYVKHVSPVADTFAWCLMKNHFHFVVRIKDLIQTEADKRLPHQFFSNLFNAHIQKLSIKDTKGTAACLKGLLNENSSTIRTI